MIANSQSSPDTLENFLADLDELLERRIKDVNDIAAVKEARVALMERAKKLGLPWNRELAHAEARRQEKLRRKEAA
jgi:hypothetical protein